ncbi:ATP-binding cassette domain-containing protein [Marinicella sp. W31]|uniref:ABC transporter ATP-binding protein n=1 Tax=Marinicella sp. W31 TaxID=3023713 RepID=UPI0037577AF3
MQQNNVISTQSISKSFGKLKALDNVSLEVKKGEILALLGANGAGKTTLINVLLGRMQADNGHISVLGQQPGHIQARRRIGTILQAAEMPGTLKVIEHINLFRSYYVNPMPIDEVLNYAQLNTLQNKRFDQLSGGQKQRVFFALAICGQPDLVFLDEPTVGLDVDSRREFWRCIRDLSARGTTILLTTHYLEEADVLADRIVLLTQGHISAEGSPEHIKKQLGGKLIRFRSSADAGIFKTLTAVESYQTKGDYHELLSEQPEETTRQLLDQCPDVRDLTITQVSLEDAFLNLRDTTQLENIT